jgi:two-component system, NtrC family, sensor histidine kinase PilS
MQIAVRLAVALLLLGAAIVVEIRAPELFPFEVVIAVLGLVFAISLGFIATVPLVETRPWLADLHSASDTLVISMLVATTGGVTSLFTPLYFLPIISASAVRFRRGALEIAGLSTALYCGIVLLHYLDARGQILLQQLIAPRTDLPPGDVALYTAGLNTFSFFAVALLSGALAERWRRADVELGRASEEIADLQVFNAFVVDNLVSGLATADHENRVITFNRAAEAITGEPRDLVIGRRAPGVLQLTSADVASLEGDPEGSRVRRVDIHYRRRDGASIDMGLSAARLPLPNGRLGYLYTFQDVTEVKQLEREAQTRQRLAAVGEMAVGISHEIRNPLGSMSGSLQILRRELTLTGDQAQLMDIVLKESDRLNHTIRSFLTYARPERTIVGPVDLRRVLTEALTLLRHSPDRDEKHELLVSGPDEPVVVDADEGQVKQVVWNLASNGLRAMPTGGRLTLSAFWQPTPEGGRQAVLSVVDQGVGIPESEIDQIFQPFRGNFPRGSGLGLAIVHRIASEHGAIIKVESALGRGTTFRITFPETEADPDPPRPVAGESDTRAERPKPTAATPEPL